MARVPGVCEGWSRSCSPGGCSAHGGLGLAGQLWTDSSGGLKLRMGLIMTESGPVCNVEKGISAEEAGRQSPA